MMDEFTMMRLYGAGFGTGVDISALIAFLVYGIISFLAPALGYRENRPLAMNLAMTLLIVYVGVAIAQVLFVWEQIIEASEMMKRSQNNNLLSYNFMFSLMKTTLFLGSMILFVIGLRGYKKINKITSD